MLATLINYFSSDYRLKQHCILMNIEFPLLAKSGRHYFGLINAASSVRLC